MSELKIKIALVDRKDSTPVAFSHVDLFRYGGKISNQPEGLFFCPNVDIMNIFKIERENSNG